MAVNGLSLACFSWECFFVWNYFGWELCIFELWLGLREYIPNFFFWLNQNDESKISYITSFEDEVFRIHMEGKAMVLKGLNKDWELLRSLLSNIKSTKVFLRAMTFKEDSTDYLQPRIITVCDAMAKEDHLHLVTNILKIKEM